MKWKTITIGLLTFGWLGVVHNVDVARAQNSTINFKSTGQADWNTGSSWDFSVVPGDGGFPDIAGISSGGVATLTGNANFNVLGLVLGESNQFPAGGPARGTLEISGAGALTVTTNGVRVGDTGLGVLNIDGGQLNVGGPLQVAGDDDSALIISGAATLNVGGNVNLNRNTRIIGPDASINIGGNLTVSGLFNPVITDSSHSTIGATSANISGILRPEFSGHSPAIGESWTIISTANGVQGVFDEIDTSAFGSLPSGVTVGVSYGNDVVLSLANRLILSVNRNSGESRIKNVLGDPIAINGYTITSTGSGLDRDDAAWNSFQDRSLDAWDEANPTDNHLSELNPTGSTTIDVGESLLLGQPYRVSTPTKFGDPTGTEDLEFIYRNITGEVSTGIVEYTGTQNSLVLIVDPATGQAKITNQSTFSGEINGYTITSASGALSETDGAWQSLQDQSISDWDEANPTPFHLSELNPTASTAFSSGESVAIGQPFQVGASQDLAFFFRIFSTGELLTGAVEYGSLGPGLSADINGDGGVDQADWSILVSNYGIAAGAQFGQGDISGDGKIGLADVMELQVHFGETVAASPTAVPEPSTILLMVLGAMGLVLFRRCHI